MMNLKMISTGVIVIAMVLGIGSRAKADYRQATSAKAQFLYDVSGEAQQSLFRQFTRSRVYGQLLGQIGQIRGKSIAIRNLSRVNVPDHVIQKEINRLDALIHKFDETVDVARRRSASGADYPLQGCTLHMDGKINAMLDAVHAMRHEFSLADCGYGQAPVVVPTYRPTIPTYQPPVYKKPYKTPRYDVPRNGGSDWGRCGVPLRETRSARYKDWDYGRRGGIGYSNRGITVRTGDFGFSINR